MNRELLHRFFKNECSPEEVHEILIWINSPEGKKEFQEAFDTFEHETVSGNSPLDSHALLAKVYDRIKEETTVKDNVPSTLTTPGRTRYFTLPRAIAAAVVFFISIAVYFYINNKTELGNQEAALKPGVMQTKLTAAGQRLTVHLSDGTVATLNANSAITYASDFSDTIRLVQMRGEVFFEVAEDKEKPFVVSTSKLNTTAMGTSFNIRAYDDRQQQISLVTGKVKVESTESDLIDYLEPGEEINLRNGEISIDTFDVLTKALWKEGIIYFDNTPLSECFKTLEQWYGVEINIQGGKLGENSRVSGRFDNDYLSNVLKSISYTHEFTYEIHKKRVHITFSR
ncbi:FecR domain-containing protein [Fulvivirgaceae bacterium BMA12]|uniref:FecR domain-containing protein n=1 Tax=Agaribacillus aureus TaxID=3051825 RepID=A0ABT8KZ99_9BACT|nr:FecR domain-containing protein [Fulvivirgaceae bacterium BMA12]